MTRDQVLALTPTERFLYWCVERHRIYLRRKDGQEKPWTDDPLLRQFYFTNTYRELDKTTVWFRENIRDPLRNSPDVMMATVIFRWFNFIPTGGVLMDPFSGAGEMGTGKGLQGSLLVNWNPQRALDTLRAIRDNGGQLFTGAFMINSPAGEPKLEAIVRRIDNVWREREHLLSRWDDSASMQGFHEVLTGFEGLGGFMAYELVCDLRFTYLLEHAEDINTWANPGPGAIRGMYRLLGREIKNKSNATAPSVPKEWGAKIIEVRELLGTTMQREFGPLALPVEAREVEMALCEYDKYVRLLLGEGKSKRKYQGE